jgi:hypothetical protein
MKTITPTAEQNNIISQLLSIKDENSIKCISLLEFFISEYPEAPGSNPLTGNHQNFPQGYYKHISDILSYAVMLYKYLSKKDKLNFTLSDAILVLFLHDIEKPIKYCPALVKTGVIDENGCFEEAVYEYETDSDEDIRQNLISKFGIKLTDEHKLALKYIHGEGDDYRKDKRVMSPLCAFCHCCDIISARIFFD